MTETVERFGPTRRGGPVIRWLGESLAIDLANTVMVVGDGESVDLLASADDLRDWLLRERSRLDECDFATGHLEEVRELRDAVRELLAAAAEGGALRTQALERVNAASAAAPVAPQLSIEEGYLKAGTPVENGGPLSRLLGTLARSAIDLLGDPEHKDLRICTAPSCGMFFVGARRWCCSACGNRARVARHYERARRSKTSIT